MKTAISESAGLFARSVIVVAHPDDEILWFSSILTRVVKIIVCFMGSKNKPLLGPARLASLQEYPLKTLICLGLNQSDTFNGANWGNPEISDFGLKIPNRPDSETKYKNNYCELRQQLQGVLGRYDNVFTHNPWGEYGNEDHVQVYQVIKSLQQELGFTLWFSNYCSNKSFKLMVQSVSGRRNEYLTLKTDENLTAKISKLYQEKGCWTWYDDWVSFREESFIKDDVSCDEFKMVGPCFPVNLLKVQVPNKSNRYSFPSEWIGNYLAKITKKIHK